MFKLVVAGGRDFRDYDLLEKKLNHLLQNKSDIEIVSGDAKGADSLGCMYAMNHHLAIKHFPADWDKFGRSAGFKRNKQMVDYADAVVCFWDGKSAGTEHTINLTKEADKPLRIIGY